MATKFIYNYDDWLKECEDRHLKIVECKCGKECKNHGECINQRTSAIDGNDHLVSVFKHFINYGVFYD